MRTGKVIWIICLFSASAVAADLATSFEKAVALAEAQEEGPATRQYFTGTLLPYYEQKYSLVFQSCFATATQPDNSPFSFVAAIGADGRVMRLYNDHKTPIFACLQSALIKDEFPKPPISPYYLHIDMQFSEGAEIGKEPHPAPPLIVKPDRYSYTFGVPAGWAFSFEQAHARGADLAFFPRGGSFDDSSSVIYVNEIDQGCSDCLSALPQRIEQTIRSARDDSPTVKIASDSPVVTKDGQKAVVRLLKGAQDPRNPQTGKDNEALAFIGHRETVILVVLTARDPTKWEQDYGAFQQIVGGHKFFNCDTPELRVPCSGKPRRGF